MGNRLTLTLVTPTRRILQTECDEVRVPGASGYFGVRPGHEALLSTLDAGPLHILDGTETDAYAVVGGFAEIADDKVLILADEAVHVDTIDVDAEVAALEEARQRYCKVQTDLLQHKLEAVSVKRHAARVATAKL